MSEAIAFAPAAESDFERLLDLRIRVLRPHLERVGRFDPERARRYFREGYDPTHLRLILVDGRFAGCVALKPDGDGLVLEHFYLGDGFQGRGIGAAVLRRLLCSVAAVLRRTPCSAARRAPLPAAPAACRAPSPAVYRSLRAL